MAAHGHDGEHRPSLVGRALTAGVRSGRRMAPALKSPVLPVPRPRSALERLGTKIGPARLAMLVPALTLGGSVATAVGAQLLADSHRRAAAALANEAEPVLAAERFATARASAIDADRPAFEASSISAILERLARDLPPDAQLASVARDPRGALRIGVLTADPDRLRGTAALVGFAALDQRRDQSGRILVLLQGRTR